MGAAALSARAIVKIVLIVVGVLLCLYILYQLRRPLTWLFIATFLAVALSPPVNFLNRYMKRGFAIGPFRARRELREPELARRHPAVRRIALAELDVRRHGILQAALLLEDLGDQK